MPYVASRFHFAFAIEVCIYQFQTNSILPGGSEWENKSKSQWSQQMQLGQRSQWCAEGDCPQM